MSTAAASNDADARGLVAGAVLGYALFFVYGSLVPLHPKPQPLADAWQFFLALPGPSWRDGERVDLAVNFLLTLPLAFGLAHLGATARRPALRLAGLAAIWPLLLLLSLGVEFAQVYFPPRDPSWTDFAAQALGSAAGLAAYGGFGARFRALLARFQQRESAQGRARAWLIAYLMLMLAFCLMPLDLSISPVELYRKWRDGRVVLLPFGSAWHGTAQFAYELLSDIGLWVPVGLLWRLERPAQGTRFVVGRVLLAAAAIEAAQLLVLSRVSDVTDILLAGVGGALGARLPALLRPWAELPPERRDAWLVRACWAWLAVAVALLWAPFDFALPSDLLAAAAEAFMRMPFQTYFFAGEFQALNEILRKLFVFLPGGLLLGARAALPLPRRLPGAGSLLLLAFALEAGQLCLPGKVADLTDALLGALGGWAGLRIARSLNLKLPAGANPGVSPVPARHAPRPAEMPAATPPAALQAFLVAALALVLWLAAHTPGLPYNVAKLFPPGFEGVLSAAGLALFAWWMFAAPLALLAPQRERWRVLAPLLVLGHGLAGFALLRATVPLKMIYKVIGDPVLGWPGPWEDIGRYLALHACIVMPLLGAALLVRAVRHRSGWGDFAYWAFTMAAVAWPLHWVVVERAGTDNLVELMRGGIGASLALGTAWLLVATAGSALAAAAWRGRRGALLLLAALALATAPWLFEAGLEPVLVKYDRVFSALQFIVSAGRDRYATGPELAFRAAAALAAMTLAVAVLQVLPWRAVAASDRPRPPRA